ncbi:hypothetical protein [Massilia litorea]|uniref:DUF1444 family protein n=1 Tax=Massilia litorea TaxID=2769491 RepID=A0A7L9TZ51_9BURK|nr:hypothetical protein [Massilia litorea]QOL47968.1 hypothetical protein LPB04_13155 [Massilia litorea]
MWEWLGFKKPSPQSFAHALMKYAADHGFDGPMCFDATRFRILTGETGNGIVNLANLYPGYRNARRSERGAHLARCFAMFGGEEMPTGFAQARANLLPAIRARSYVESASLSAGAHGVTVFGDGAFAVLGSDAVVVLAYDHADSMNILTGTQVEALGVPFATALDAALANLRDRSVETLVRRPDGVCIAAWNDAYDSSRILLPDVVHRAGIANPVAMVPTRDQLLVAPASDRAALLAMLDLAQACHEHEGRPVSASLFHFEHGSAQEFVPDDAEVVLRLANLKQLYLADDHACQKQDLDADNEQRSIDLFVATFAVWQREGDPRLVSACTWSEGVEALLPRTDMVSFVSLDEAGQLRHAGTVEWAQVHAVAGHLMAPEPGMYPVRYRVSHFPDLRDLGLQ